MKNCVIYHHRTRAEGAEGVHIRGIKKALMELGFVVEDVSLVNTDFQQSAEKVVHKNLGSFFWRMVSQYLPNTFFKLLELGYPLRAYLAGRSSIEKIKYSNICFIYDRYAYFSFGLSLLCKRKKIPLIMEMNTTCLDYDVREIKFKHLARKIEKFCVDNAFLIVVVSEYLKEKICSLYEIDADKIVVTPNAVCPDEFLVDAEFVAGQTISNKLNRLRKHIAGCTVIGFVGGFVPWHGLDLLLKVFDKINSEHQYCNKVKLVLVGDGPMREDVECFIKENQFESNILITGMVPHQDVKVFIDLFDIAVMPDSNPFGSPMKIFEYMVMGKPVVAPAYGPILEIIQHKENGLIFQERNVEEMQNQLIYLLENPSFRIKLGQSGQVSVMKKHTWNHNVNRILEAAQKRGY